MLLVVADVSKKKKKKLGKERSVVCFVVVALFCVSLLLSLL